MNTTGEQRSLATDRLWVFCLGPAIAMMLGWGLRGFIGGGPLGAMIPGAMVALLLCLILKLDERGGAMLTAIGAIGIGLGGQMTYGQTIGFIVQPETFWWGLLGLSVKGGVWGLSGGALLGLGLSFRQIPRRDFVIALLVLLAGVIMGWQFINEPKLIYFSNRHDKPRAEIWAGLLLGAVALLGWLAARGQTRTTTRLDSPTKQRRSLEQTSITLSPSDGERDGVRGGPVAIGITPFQIALHFALWGTLGGAVGFGGGGLWMVAGQALPELKAWASWWKFMEFTFGFCFGLTLGLATWLNRAAICAAQTNPSASATPLPFSLPIVVASVAFVGAVLWCEASVDVVCTYTFLGVALLMLCAYVASFAWQVGMTITIAAFVYDLVEKFHEGPGWVGPNVKWPVAALAATIVAVALVVRLRRARPMVNWCFLILTWSAVVVSYLKSLREFPFSASHTIVGLIFTLSAVWLTWLVTFRLRASVENRSSPTAPEAR